MRFCATEQLFGIMLSSEVTLVESGAVPLRPWTGRGVHARIDLAADDRTALSILFRADEESARAISAHLLGAAPADILEADLLVHRGRVCQHRRQPAPPLPRGWRADAGAAALHVAG